MCIVETGAADRTRKNLVQIFSYVLSCTRIFFATKFLIFMTFYLHFLNEKFAAH